MSLMCSSGSDEILEMMIKFNRHRITYVRNFEVSGVNAFNGQKYFNCSHRESRIENLGDA